MLTRESRCKSLVKMLQGHPDTEQVSSKKAFISLLISSRQIGTVEIKAQVFLVKQFFSSCRVRLGEW